MKTCRLKYKAVISEDIAIVGYGWFAQHDGDWRFVIRDYICEVIVKMHQKSHSIEINQTHGIWIDAWEFEMLALIREDDFELISELNAAWETQKHEGAY